MRRRAAELGSRCGPTPRCTNPRMWLRPRPRGAAPSVSAAEGLGGRGADAGGHHRRARLQPGRRRGPVARLVRLTERGTVAVCADHPDQVAAFSRAVTARRAETGSDRVTLDVLVEMDCGSGRCGTGSIAESVALARAIDDSPGLRFAGLQSYYGRAQHIVDPAERRAALATSIALTEATRDAIRAEGLSCDRITGAGTGSFEIEGASGVYTEIQAGSYAFMDADYARVRGEPRRSLRARALRPGDGDQRAGTGRAVCDAGLKAVAADSGLPSCTASPHRGHRPLRRALHPVRSRGAAEPRRADPPDSRALRPDLQPPRLVCRDSPRPRRMPLAGHGARQGVLIRGRGGRAGRGMIGPGTASPEKRVGKPRPRKGRAVRERNGSAAQPSPLCGGGWRADASRERGSATIPDWRPSPRSRHFRRRRPLSRPLLTQGPPSPAEGGGGNPALYVSPDSPAAKGGGFGASLAPFRERTAPVIRSPAPRSPTPKTPPPSGSAPSRNPCRCRNRW